MTTTTTEATGRVTSFYHLFKQPGREMPVHSIEIPMIQRDYAQGRRTLNVDRIRGQFIRALCNAVCSSGEAIELDFIYGDVDSTGKLMPLDGQQRLTALFLLHCYLAWRIKMQIAEQPWAKFSYATRPSARRFCEFLTLCQPDFPNMKSLSKWLIDQADFLPTWEYDPTVQSMLVVLDGFHDWFSEHPEVIPQDAWNRLISSTEPAIRFHFLPMKQLGLTDVQYIKLNSRGKPLTPFENFKAQFEEMLSQVHPNHARSFADKVDTDWSDVFWAYVDKQETADKDENHLIDDKFLRYFCFVSEVCALNAWPAFEEPGSPDDLSYLDHLAENIYGKNAKQADENLLLLLALLDVWKSRNAKELFESLLTKDPQMSDSRLLMFNFGGFDVEGVDMLHACSSYYGSGRWTFAHTLLFYGILLHYTSQGMDNRERHFVKRLRVLRNLISASINEIRFENMPKLLSDVKKLIMEGNIEQISTFNQAQKENELEKASLLSVAEQLRKEINRLEDHELLQGGLTSFELEPVRFSLRAQAFQSVFRRSTGDNPWIDAAGALLTQGDYSRTGAPRWTGYAFIQLGPPSNNKPWQQLFRGRGTRNNPHPMCKPLMSLLDAVSNGRSLKDEIDSYVNGNGTPKDWRYYLIKYPFMRYGESGLYYFNPCRYKACMTRSDSGLLGYYYDPYLWAVVKESCIPEDSIANKHWPRAFFGYESDPRCLILRNSGLKLQSVDEGWELSDIPVDSKMHGACQTVIRDCKTSASKEGKVLVEVPKNNGFDAQDRIQLGASILKKLVDAGL